jgi:predicted secreted protein
MTAVEYLFQIFGQHTEVWRKEMEQALEMEKQQIKDAYIEGKFNSDIKDIAQSSEQYYSETYKKDNP